MCGNIISSCFISHYSNTFLSLYLFYVGKLYWKNIQVKTKTCSGGDGGGGFTKTYFDSSDSDDNNPTSNDGDDHALPERVVSNDLMEIDDDPNNPNDSIQSSNTHSLSCLGESIVGIILSFLKPRDVLSFATCCKKAPNPPLVTMDQCVSVVLNSGPCGVQSMINVYNLMVRKAIHPVSVERVLRLGCGVKCEFCLQHEVRVTRPQWAVHACWTCLNNNVNQESNNDDTWNLNRRWNREFLRGGNKRFVKAYYLAHRDAIFQALSDPQVIAYCYGDRIVKSTRNGKLVRSKDRFEILYRSSTRDNCNMLIGPRFTYDMMRNLIPFLEEDRSHTVRQFLAQGKDAPSDIDYDEFVASFDKSIDEAKSKQAARKQGIADKKYHSRLEKTERVLDALHKVSLYLSVETLNSSAFIDEACENQIMLGELPVTQQTVNALNRLLLCYREEDHLLMDYCITFDTGNYRVDCRLMELFATLMKAPSKVTDKDARFFAMKFWANFDDDVNRAQNRIPALFDEPENEFDEPVLKTTFPLNQPWMRPQFKRDVYSKWKRGWTDTSKNRRY